MPTSTTNYGLIKPGTDDPILIEQLNTNADIIDNALKENADALGGKVDKETGKGLSTNDFTTAEKTKLDDLAEIKSIGTGLNLDSSTGELTATGGGSGGTTNYNDLSNKPQINGNTLSGNKTSAQLGLASASDIPTVPITAIQKNGTGITPVSGTVNITVPTTAADVSALPDTTKYAAALSLTINSSTFVMTGQLKDQNGDNLGTAQTIDLPLESVVVGGSYNSQTKKVVLTLQNGNTIEFSVADLVSGLQTEFSASNKLNPAYINYDSTHRAVSDTEKSTWNGKQNALSSTQLDAVNSGIDSTKVEQIETNKNNILWNTRSGVSNVLPLNSVYKRGVHADVTEPSKIHFYGTPDSGGTLSGLTKRIKLTEGTYTITVDTDFDTSLNTDIYLYDMTTSNTIMTIETSGTYEFTANPTHEYLYAFFFNSGVAVDFNYQVNVRPKNSPDVGFQSYALSNAELTAKNAVNENNISKDEAALVEIVNGGAKNELLLTLDEMKTQNISGIWSDNSYVVNGITFTVNDDMTITVDGTLTGDRALFILFYNRFNIWGGEILSGCPAGGSPSGYGINFEQVASPWDTIAVDYGNSTTISDNASVRIYGYINIRKSVSNLTFKPMICSKTTWDVSQTYQPYRPSYQDLYEMVKALQANQ